MEPITKNLFAWTPENKQHLSVGAVIVNEKGEILVHKLARIGNKYFLPKKTHHSGQTLEATLATIEKETGWKVEAMRFLGSIKSQFGDATSGNIDKTTLYLLCKPTAQTTRDSEDRDADSELLWVPQNELVNIFEQQGQTQPELNEAAVITNLNN